MEKFYNAQISVYEKSVFVKLGSMADGVTLITRGAIFDISRDGVPLGFELFEASSIALEFLNAIDHALEKSDVPYSLDDEVDILTVNMNGIDEASITNAPGIVHFGFDPNGRLVSLFATLEENAAE